MLPNLSILIGLLFLLIRFLSEQFSRFGLFFVFKQFLKKIIVFIYVSEVTVVIFQFLIIFKLIFKKERFFHIFYPTTVSKNDEWTRKNYYIFVKEERNRPKNMISSGTISSPKKMVSEARESIQIGTGIRITLIDEIHTTVTI